MTNFLEVVCDELEKNVPGLRMNHDRRNETLRELGVDSLDVMMVLLSIQEATGIIIPEEKVDDLNTPAKIAEFLASQ